MASYNWVGLVTGNWTTSGNWSPAGYPNSLVDTASYPNTGGADITVDLSADVLLGSLRDMSIRSFNVSGSGTITFASGGSIDGIAAISYVSARVVSQPTGFIALRGGSSARYVLKNPNNSIYQIGYVSSGVGFGFDSVGCLGITHPTHIFDPSVLSIGFVEMYCTGTGGTLAKSLWAGTTPGGLRVYSDGTGALKVGVSGTTVYMKSLTVGGSIPLQSDSDDNELLNSFVFSSATSIIKSGTSRWILSGAISGSITSLAVGNGALQLPLARINASTYSTVNVSSSINSCFEVSGTGTVRSSLSVVLSASVVGTNRMGGFRATSGSNITISTLTMNAGTKIAAALGATLVVPTLANNPQNNFILYFGGEGTVELQYALGGAVSIEKEDSGTLKMSTNNKTYSTPTTINGGTVWCDGPNRISGSNLVTVANGCKLRSSYVGTTALSVKALTLNTGSIVQVD